MNERREERKTYISQSYICTVRIPLGISVFDEASALQTAANTLASRRTEEALQTCLRRRWKVSLA